MTSHTVNLQGQEHLPPVLRLFTDPSYQYSTHKHSIIPTDNGSIEHVYTVIVSNNQLSDRTSAELLEETEKNVVGFKHVKKGEEPAIRHYEGGNGHLVSQISSTTTSEKKIRGSSLMSPMIAGSLSSIEKTKMPSSIVTSSSDNSSSYIGSSTFSSSGLSSDARTTILSSTTSPYGSTKVISPIRKALVRPNASTSSEDFSSSISSTSSDYSRPSLSRNGSTKFVMMVHVKFLLLHRDVFRKRVQSVFTDEFPSDCPLEDVVFNFHQLCSRKLRDEQFHPRLAYCIGDLNRNNSKPVQPSDMSKTLSQLANSHSIAKFALIVDNINGV